MLKSPNHFEAMRPSVAKALKGFAATGEPPDEGQWVVTRLLREEYPVPELLHVLLHDVMGFRRYGAEDKVRWTVHFWVSGRPFFVQLAKFGLKLGFEEANQSSVTRVRGQLQQALGRLEDRIKPLIDAQVAAGNVTLENRSTVFRSRYEFFRENADAAFLAADRKPRPPRARQGADSFGGELNKLFRRFAASGERRRQGFYYSVAMVDAYYSYLEHRLVLLRGFLGQPLPKGGIKEVLAARWDDKFNAVVGNAQGRYGPLLGRLRILKEDVRNPFAHGGSQNDGGAIFCHVPGLGAIPGNLSRTRHSANFKWIPVDTGDHRTSCRLFDETDEVLSSGHLAKASQLAEGGIHPVWTAESLASYRKLIRRSVKAIDEYMEHWHRLQDQHDNMDC